MKALGLKFILWNIESGDPDPTLAAEAIVARVQKRMKPGSVIVTALADMGHVLSADPRHYDVLAGLGTILEETGDEKRALKAYLVAQAIHPYIQPVNDAIERLETKLEGQEL